MNGLTEEDSFTDSEDKFFCICYDPQSSDSTSSLSRECCLTCKRHKICLVNIIKKGPRTFLLGLCDVFTSSRFIKIIPPPHSHFQYSCVGLLSPTVNDRTRVLFYTDKDVDFLQLDTEGVPEFQVLRCDVSRLVRPVLYLSDLQTLLAAYSTDLQNLFAISVIRSVEDSIMLYCDQPLADKHADCQICRDLHINLHWDEISAGELWSGARYFNDSCQCPFYDVKLLEPYDAGDSWRRIYLAEAVNLPKNTQTVRLSFDKQSSGQSCIGSAVLWKGGRSFVGVSVDNNKISKVPKLCQIRCIPSRLCVSFERIEALLSHLEIYPDNPECTEACLFILRSTILTESTPLPTSSS